MTQMATGVTNSVLVRHRSTHSQKNRPQTAKYIPRGQELTTVDSVSKQKNRNIQGEQISRVRSAKELAFKVIKKSLRSGLTPTVSNVISNKESVFGSRKMSPSLRTKPEFESFKAVAFIDGESHSFNLGGKKYTIHERARNKIASTGKSRSRTRIRSTPSSKFFIDQTLKEKIKALKATKNISHSIKRSESGQITQMKKSESPALTRIMEPLINVQQRQVAVPMRAQSTRRNQKNNQVDRHVVKSMGLLKAYDEFGRFMRLSKQHMREAKREIRIKVKQQKPLYENTSNQPLARVIQQPDNMGLYQKIKENLKM